MFSYVSLQVAEYVSLPEAMLRGFLEKYREEEQDELDRLLKKSVDAIFIKTLLLTNHHLHRPNHLYILLKCT